MGSSPAEAAIPSVAPAPVELLSVVVPAWNEAATMPELLRRILDTTAPLARKTEILVVVPTPDDPTASVAAEHGAEVLAQRRPGYGGALREGLARARGDYVVTMDADLSHPPETIAELFARRDDAEVVIASRYVSGGTADMSAWRRGLSQVLNAVYRRVLAVSVQDMSSGYRIYQRRVLSELALESEQYDVLEEILVKIFSLGWHVLEIPFDYGDRAAGQSHANVVSFTPHFLRTLFRLWRMRNSFYSADYDSRAFDSWVLPQRMWQRQRYRLITRMAAESAGGTAGGTAERPGHAGRLDVGCGSSRILQSTPDAVGVDVEMSKLRFLRRTNPKLLRGTTFQLPFRDESFSTVVSSQVIEHVVYDPALFHELNRVLTPGGTLVLGTPDYGRAVWRAIEWLYKLLLPGAYGDDHITRYTRHTLTEELVRSGFAVREVQYVYAGELVVKAVKCDEPDLARPGDPSPGS